MLLVAAMMAHLGDAVTAFCKGNPSLAAVHVQKLVLRLTEGSGQWLEVQPASICSLNLLYDSKHGFVDEGVAWRFEQSSFFPDLCLSNAVHL